MTFISMHIYIYIYLILELIEKERYKRGIRPKGKGKKGAMKINEKMWK